MIAAIAVVPQPPLLLPQLAAGAAGATDGLRHACLQATAWLGRRCTRWIAVGADPAGPARIPQTAVGSWRGFGADVTVRLAAPVDGADPVVADPRLALPLLVAGWLRGQAAPGAAVVGELVAPDLATAECRALGVRLAGTAGSWGLLVVGDGAATHTEKAPGYFDARAAAFDADVRLALRDASPPALLALPAQLGCELQAAGRAGWQVLAGAAERSGDWQAELLYSAAPYGVGYHVACWRPHGSAP